MDDMNNLRKINYCSKCGVKFSDFVNYVPNFCPNCGFQVVTKHTISNSNLKCLICHKHILKHQKVIICSYCSSVFHYSCSAVWFNRHNACPLCQNVFLYPKNRKI
ncbi:MAG: hypothetical protein EU550_00985 [Promethearchaeota archaeon]|nr:MAG: hypothetical protein EU550_00985 [Candidatus Lokiarchaeota archaeon]